MNRILWLMFYCFLYLGCKSNINSTKEAPPRKDTVLSQTNSGYEDFTKVQDVISFDTILPLNLPILADEEETYLNTVWKNHLWIYLLPEESVTYPEKIELLRVNLNTFSVEKLEASAPSLDYDPMSCYVYGSLAVNDKYCVIGFCQSVFIFELNNDQLQLIDTINLDVYAEYVELMDEKVLVGQCQNTTREEASADTYLGIYDIKRKEFTKIIHPDFEVIEFSQSYPHHWIDASDEFILFTQTVDYDINIYDLNLNQIGELKRDIKDWSKIDKYVIEEMNSLKKAENWKEYSQYVMKNLFLGDQNISRIIGAYFINKTTIIVQYNLIPKTEIENYNIKYRNRFYDIWQYNNNKWELIHANLMDGVPQEKIRCTKENFPLDIVGDVISFHFTNENLIEFKVDYINQYFGKTYGKIMKLSYNDYSDSHYNTNVHIYNLDY